MTGGGELRSALADPVDRVLEVSVGGSFSRLGYEARSRLLPEYTAAPEPPLAGRTVLITGATSGIGLSAAIGLARHGASVHFLARSKQRAERTRRQVAVVAAGPATTPTASATGSPTWTASSSVRDFASEFAAGHDRLDVLIHNAGAIHPGYQRNERRPRADRGESGGRPVPADVPAVRPAAAVRSVPGDHRLLRRHVHAGT